MIIKEYSSIQLDKEVIRQDKKTCLYVENHGIGKEAIYLGNYFFARCKVIPIRSILRVYKRVAMSKGGFTGKGVFGSIPYIVVVYDEGYEVSAAMKDELLLDKALDYIKENFPQIKTLSAKQEELLEKVKKEREARKKKDLSTLAKETLQKLYELKEKFINQKDVYRAYSIAAKNKRASMLSKDVYIYFLWVILAFGVITTIYGIYAIIHKMGYSLYITVFGFALIFFFISTGILPTQRNNKKYINDAYKKAQNVAIGISESFVGKNFDVPSKYLHFATIGRLITIIEEGRGEGIKDSYEQLISELKSMNKDVKLYPDEYEEVMAIKPIFLIEDYK